MDNFHDLLVKRHSIRKYTDEPIAEADLHTILEAALLAPTSKNMRSWHFTVIKDADMLGSLAKMKPMFATAIERSALTIVVSGNASQSDAWIEDASIAATYIQLQAEALGLGSCWIQVRNRTTAAEGGEDSGTYVKRLLGLADDYEVLCAIAIGHKAEERRPANLEKLLWDHVTTIDGDNADK